MNAPKPATPLPWQAYIRRIRNPQKRAYAEAWVRYCTQRLQEAPLPTCGYMAAQAVRLDLANMGVES